MAYLSIVDRAGATPLRRAPATCVMVMADATVPVVLHDVTGAGARVTTSARPPVGSVVTLRHPQGGTIAAEVSGHALTGFTAAFARDEHALGFALAALVS